MCTCSCEELRCTCSEAPVTLPSLSQPVPVPCSQFTEEEKTQGWFSVFYAWSVGATPIWTAVAWQALSGAYLKGIIKGNPLPRQNFGHCFLGVYITWKEKWPGVWLYFGDMVIWLGTWNQLKNSWLGYSVSSHNAIRLKKETNNNNK